jgi:hypothetical protein
MARGNSPQLTVSLRALVDGVAERLLQRVQKGLPTREQLRALEKEVRLLGRKLDAVRLRSTPSRVGRPRLDRKCKIGGCGLPHVAQGFCSKHYQAWRRGKMRARAVGKS